MSCMNVNISRKGGDINTSVTRAGGMEDFLTRFGGTISCNAERIGWMSVTTERKGRMSCAMYQVCTSITNPYLEISPSVVWLLAGHTENEVYSNTLWQID